MRRRRFSGLRRSEGELVSRGKGNVDHGVKGGFKFSYRHDIQALHSASNIDLPSLPSQIPVGAQRAFKIVLLSL
jgi:hypothetical protein